MSKHHSLNRLNLLTLLFVWNIWIYHLNCPPKVAEIIIQGRKVRVGVGKETDGSSGKGRLWAARGLQEAALCLEGRESEMGVGTFRKRGGGKNSYAYLAVLPRALAVAQLASKKSSMLSAINCWCLNLNIRTTWSSKKPQAPLVQVAGAGVPYSSFSSSVRFLLVYNLALPARGLTGTQERKEEREGVACIQVPPSLTFFFSSSLIYLQVH